MSSFIKIADNEQGHSLDNFCIPSHYRDDLQSVLMSNGLICDRVKKMAQDIANDFQSLENSSGIAALCVLKGGFQFFSDLMAELKNLNQTKSCSIPIQVEFIRMKSYSNDYSTGSVQVMGIDDLESLRGKDVLIVEDIVDTGNTMKALLSHLQSFGPRSLKCASLLVKRTPLASGYRPDYTGFEIPDAFVVGYGLDFNEHFRDFTHIGIISEQGKKKYAN